MTNNLSKKLKDKKKYLIPILTSSLLIILLSITIWVVIYKAKTYVDKLIVDDMVKLDSIFKKINKTAGILGFEQDKNQVNFLNIEKFAGSQVGGLSLAHPEKWEGPYLQTNPTIQEKFYQVIRTNKGYFLVPGDGAKLANGKVIGEDIILDRNTDIEQLIREKELFASYEKPIAIKINTINDQKNLRVESEIEPFVREDSEMY